MCVLEIVLDDGDEFGRSTVSLEMASYQLEIGHFVLRSFRARSCSARIVSSSAFSRYSRSLATMKSESRPISGGLEVSKAGFNDQPDAVGAIA